MRSGLIIEDIPETQSWLSRLLQKSFPGIHIETAETVEQGNKLIQSKRHDIALVDLGLPDGSGIDCIILRSIRWPGKPSIVSTSFEEDEYLFKALQAGAAGYIMKDSSDDEVISLLQGINCGIPPLSPVVARKIMAHFQLPASSAETEKLTATEKELLVYIVKGHTVPETAELLGKSRNTVATQLKSIYSKLNVSSRAAFTQKVIQLGLA